MPQLICKVCGNIKEVPRCCEESMIVKEGYLLCCCHSENCGYKVIPKCCDTIMEYVRD